VAVNTHRAHKVLHAHRRAKVTDKAVVAVRQSAMRNPAAMKAALPVVWATRRARHVPYKDNPTRCAPVWI
jgi:hypothetical protein